MKARTAHHKTILEDAQKVDASDNLVVKPGEKQYGDVSKQDLQRALQESRESEGRLRKIIDTIPTLAWCNLSDGSNDFVNQRWSNYTGLSQADVKRVGCKVAIHPEDLPKWLDQWRALLASGKGGEIEARLRRHDGTYRWFLIRVEPLQEESGRILRWYGTNTDIEDRKRTEEKLREDEREIRRITDAIPQTIMVLNPSGVPIYANQALLDYTGFTIDDVVSADFRARIFHPEPARGRPFPESPLDAIARQGGRRTAASPVGFLRAWALYALVYFGFARATTAWQAWALFGVYGIFFGLTEGSERALIADLVIPERRGTAYGWYNLAIGIGALPASILFGWVWDHAGAPAAFVMGASLALAAALGMLLVVPRRTIAT